MNRSLRWPNANPNGVPPAEGVGVGPEALPFASLLYTSSRLVVFSVTTRWRPLGLTVAVAGPTFEPESGWVEPAIRVSPPLLSTVKPLILPLPPAFSTYSSLPCTVRLIGRVPPEDVPLAGDRPAAPPLHTDTSLEPALTAKSRRPSPPGRPQPCEPRPRARPGPPERP